MIKFALEIRTREKATNKILSWFTQGFETEKELDDQVEFLWKLKEAYKKEYITEIEYITHLDRVHGRI